MSSARETAERIVEDFDAVDAAWNSGIIKRVWLRERIAAAIASEREACAKLLEERAGNRPCDCVYSMDGVFANECHCKNSGDLSEVSGWCSTMNDASAIRGRG